MSAKKMVSRGQVHVYTGDGKGKTTAAFGLALRACMSGKKVFIGQFIKSMRYNETRIADFFENISVELFGCGCMLMRAPDEADKPACAGRFAQVCGVLEVGRLGHGDVR